MTQREAGFATGFVRFFLFPFILNDQKNTNRNSKNKNNNNNCIMLKRMYEEGSHNYSIDNNLIVE